MIQEAVTYQPPRVRHHIEGVRSADLPVCGLEVLMHRRITLKRWSLVAAADAYWRLYRPLSKGGLIRFGGETFELQPGRLYLIAPHTRFDSEAVRPFSKWYVHFTLRSTDGPPAPFLAELSPDARMQQLLCGLCPARRKPEPRSKASETWHLIELLALTLEQAAPQLQRHKTRDERLRRVIAHMQRELSGKLTLAELSQPSNLSERGLTNLFIEHTGLSPIRYLTELRLNHCQMLLRQTKLSIEEIAEQSGFANRHYLTRMMSKYRHTTPSAFRRLGTREASASPASKRS